MSDAFKDVSTVPTLTLEPFQAEEEKKPAVQPEEPKLDDTILTEEERRMVDAFAQQIDLTNSSMILQYGAGTQKKMADFSESALENVKSKDLRQAVSRKMPRRRKIWIRCATVLRRNCMILN